MRYAHLSPEHLKGKAELVSFKMPSYAGVVPLRRDPPNHLPTMELKEDEKVPRQNQPFTIQLTEII